MKTTKTDLAFKSSAFPCNSLPFLNRMIEIVKENGNDAQTSDQYKANLLVIMGQTFGQLATIDICDLYQELSPKLTIETT
jgi:hypothetical protein